MDVSTNTNQNQFPIIFEAQTDMDDLDMQLFNFPLGKFLDFFNVNKLIDKVEYYLDNMDDASAPVLQENLSLGNAIETLISHDSAIISVNIEFRDGGAIESNGEDEIYCTLPLMQDPSRFIKNVVSHIKASVGKHAETNENFMTPNYKAVI